MQILDKESLNGIPRINKTKEQLWSPNAAQAVGKFIFEMEL